jgi:hypothetical protein
MAELNDIDKATITHLRAIKAGESLIEILDGTRTKKIKLTAETIIATEAVEANAVASDK